MTSERAAEIDEFLLKSLEDGPRFLDMARSPVEAIERCFALADLKLIQIDELGWVYLEKQNEQISDISNSS